MKKTLKLIALLFLGSLIMLSACKDDSDDDVTPVELKPLINFLVEQGYIYEDATVPVDTVFRVKVFAEENPESKKNIETLEVTRIFNLNSWDTTFQVNDDQITFEFTFTAQSQEGEEKIEFEVVDKDGQSNMIELLITTVIPPNAVDISTYADITLGSFNEPNFGSFFVSSNGTVMDKTTATQNQGQIDFVFYLGATNGPTIGAPSNNDVKTVFDLDGAGWTVFNETMFEFPAPIDDIAFDAIGNEYAFPEFMGTADDAKQLEADDVIFFKTVTGKLGYIKVNAINARGDIINIDVKVEK